MERKLYEQNRFDTDSIACLIEPQILAAGTTSSIWLGVHSYDRLMFIIQGGAANDATATLDALVRQATSAAGAGAKVITGKAITQVTAGAGFATLNDLWYIHVEPLELDVNGGFSHVQLQVIVSQDDTWYISAVCQRETREYEIVPTTNVTEIVD